MRWTFIPLLLPIDARETNHAVVRENQFLYNLIKHHGPPLRRGKSRYQISVENTGQHSANGAAGIAAETICNQPFCVIQLLRLFTLKRCSGLVTENIHR